MQSSPGLGLVEVVVASFIVAIIIMVAAVFFSFFLRSYSFSFEENRIIGEAESMMRKMSAEIREARTSENGAYPLVEAGDFEIMFYADVDNDGVVDRVRYYLEDEKLYRGLVLYDNENDIYESDSEVIRVLSDYVVNGDSPIFYYYNSNWPGDEVNNPLEQNRRLLDTRLVRIVVLVNTTTNPNIGDFELESAVMIRNLKDY